MLKVREVIVVEGRYDINTVKQAVDATVIETRGFGIFSDSEKAALLRRLAEKQGLIILTDSDGAGFLIRGKLKSMLGTAGIKHGYIPDIYGKEKRKRTASNEGKLGVEGMAQEIIIKALRQAGATFYGEGSLPASECEKLTKADMYRLQLSGTSGASENRRRLLTHLGLPSRLTANGLLDVLNILYQPSEVYELIKKTF